MTEQKKHQAVVVGGGFGGVKAALELAKRDNINVTLVSERDDFRYFPTLYHTATGGLKRQSSIPLNTILPDNVAFVQGKVDKLNREKKEIELEGGDTVHYDTLVLGLGSVTNYFGINGLKEYAYGVKSLEEVEKFKEHLHEQLQDEHKPDLNYIIVGAGPTGIELAGALPTYLQKIMDNHGVKKKKVNIDLIEAMPKLLPRSPESTSNAVKKQLSKLGIKLMVGAKVEGETADALMVNGQPLPSHTVVWTAGVANNPFFEANGFKVNERHKVVVDEHLLAEPHIYVIGDNAATQFSGMAQTALHDAVYVARDIAGEKQPAYKPVQPISIIPAGEGWAAVDWGKHHFNGKMGWAMREAADWAGFHDLEPWWKATEQWATELGHEESCQTCVTANQSA